MCRTTHALLSVGICGIQMLVRVFMTVILMLENMIRMLLQTFYNFLSFMLQLLSLIPICCVFLVSSRLKCFMCGGGGPCPVNRGGACDCLMSLFAIIIMFFIFRATGTLDRIFWSIGYAKAVTRLKYVPTTGTITECSRNDTDTEYIFYNMEPETAPLMEFETTNTDYDSDYETIFRNTETGDPTEFEYYSGSVKVKTSFRADDLTGIFETLGFETVNSNTEISDDVTALQNLRQNVRTKVKEKQDDKKMEDWTTVHYYIAA